MASKRQRPSVDTSFTSLSLDKPQPQPPQESRTSADSAASHSSSSAFATPPEGYSPRHSLQNTGSGSNTADARKPSEPSTGSNVGASTSTGLQRLHSRTASVGSSPLYEFVKAKYDYIPDHPSGLPFYAGQLIQVHYKDPSGWWDGEVSNIRGWFPSNYLFQNSSRFVRASSQSPRLNGVHRPRNASIDVPTPSDVQNAQIRPVASSISSSSRSQHQGQTDVSAPLQLQAAPGNSGIGFANGPYVPASRRRPSLATTQEQNETELNDRRDLGPGFGFSSQTVSHPNAPSSVHNSSSQAYPPSASLFSPQIASASTVPIAGSATQAHMSPMASASFNPQTTSAFFGSQQQQQQDWASLSFEDLVALQTLLVEPSPLAKLRHPNPSATPFEAELASQLFTFANGRPPSFSTERAWDYKTGGTQFLAVVHRALWVLENAALATAIERSAHENWNSDAAAATAVANPSASTSTSPMLSQGPCTFSSSLPLEGRDHLAPAMACVIGIVRSVLSTSECLARDSISLQKFPILLNHRKVVLGELARLVGQTKRVGSRGLEEELSPVVDDLSRRGSENTGTPLSPGSTTAQNPLLHLSSPFLSVFEQTVDIEIRRELERCQSVYDSVRRFVLAAAECGIHLEEPPRGVLSLFGLLDEDQEAATVDGESEPGEGSWEEDHGFRFRVRSGSVGRFGEGYAHPHHNHNHNDDAQVQAQVNRYAMRARAFTDARTGAGRRRAGSTASLASGYASGSGYGSHGSISAGARTRANIHATVEGIEQRLAQVAASIHAQPRSRASNESSTSGESGNANSGIVRFKTAGARSIATPPESEVEGTPGAASALAAAAALRAARSMGDMRARYQIRTDRDSHIRPQAPDARFTASVKAARRARVITGRAAQNPSISTEADLDAEMGDRRSRANKSSISSVSSAGSSSSARSSSPTQSSSSPSSPGLPSGQCSVFQVLQALRITQDRILHGTAAFIGAAQYHSKTSHPASKGHLVSLTREIVDYVRRLLIIADAILGNPTVRTGRAREVEMAGVYKARLYVEMNRVVDAVREITAVRREDSEAGSSADHGDADDDEEGRAAVLKRAHLTNKCAAELVLALKLCLSFRIGNARNASGEGVLMITIPDEIGKAPESSRPPSSPSNKPQKRVSIAPTQASTTSPERAERTTKPYARFSRINIASESPAAPSFLASRNRSFTTRAEQVDHVAKFGLHKKSVSMVGMNTAYRARPSSLLHSRESSEGLHLKRNEVHLNEAMATYDEVDEERDEESDRERRPLLMSESYDSDGDDDLVEEAMLEDYPPAGQSTEEATGYMQARPARRSVEQVRKSLEQRLRQRPSIANLVEPSTPIDGTEDVVEIVEEEAEEPANTLVPSVSDKALPEPPLSAPPTHAPPPKPAHHHDQVVSNNGNIIFNKEGVLIGATLQALVDRMTPADVIGDPKLQSHFLLTFRLFATPSELVDAIIHRFNYPIGGVPTTENESPMASTGSLSETQRGHIADVVHLRVLNFVKEWTRGHWYPPHDQEALPKLLAWFRELAAGSNPKVTGTAKRMLPTLEEMSAMGSTTAGSNTDTVRDRLDRMRATVRLRDTKTALAMATMSSGVSPTTPISATPAPEAPRPLNKSVMNQLKARQFGTISILEFSPVETARQLTILENRLYCELPPEEVIEIDISGRKKPHVKALTTLSTAITGWVTDWVLKEGLDVKKRVAFIKFFLKVGKECLVLNNYSTPRSLIAALESTPISRLKSVWTALSPKHKLVLQEMHDLFDHSNNSRNYRRKLEATALPAVPFLGRILTDVTFVKEGNRPFRESPVDSSRKLINFNRYNFLAKILGDMIRFQQPYNLREIPEMQQYLNYVLDPSRFTMDADVLYRRSHLIEPRVEDDKHGKTSDLFGWASNFGSVRGNPLPLQPEK